MLHILSGMLEKPVFSLGLVPEVFEYKLFISGKCGVGKTAAVAKLTANNVPTSHCETPGNIIVSNSAISVDDNDNENGNDCISLTKSKTLNFKKTNQNKTK